MSGTLGKLLELSTEVWMCEEPECWAERRWWYQAFLQLGIAGNTSLSAKKFSTAASIRQAETMIKRK